jgi:hypothetical protein
MADSVVVIWSASQTIRRDQNILRQNIVPVGGGPIGSSEFRLHIGTGDPSVASATRKRGCLMSLALGNDEPRTKNQEHFPRLLYDEAPGLRECADSATRVVSSKASPTPIIRSSSGSTWVKRVSIAHRHWRPERRQWHPKKRLFDVAGLLQLGTKNQERFPSVSVAVVRGAGIRGLRTGCCRLG